MIYDISLTLAHHYSAPASAGRHIACVLPRDLGPEQRLIAGLVSIAPDPSQRHDRCDFFGNTISEFALGGPHDAVAVTLQARVERIAPRASDAPLSLAELPAALGACRWLGPDSPLHYVAASPRAPLSPVITAFAAAAIAPDMTVQAAVTAIGRALHRAMVFDAKATTVDTPAADAFAARRGVCQDFSQIMIAGLRGIGVPAGYVSGYLRTLPPLGHQRLAGADAMHAWVRAWCGPDAGWCAFDPTNDGPAGLSHIVAAYGRDYADVSPIRGILRVAGGQRSKQSVDVIPVESG